MAEDKFESRETNWRHLLPWIELFRGFGVALDLNKLLLAAGGIVTMAFGWWFLSFLFSASEPGEPPNWGASVDKSDLQPIRLVGNCGWINAGPDLVG